MDKNKMTEQMKYEVVAIAIASFQAALEKEFTGRGIMYASTLNSIITEFATRQFFAYNLFPEREDVSQTKTPEIQA